MTTSYQSDEENVLYGGPSVELVEADARSLGEVVLRMLAKHDERVIMVESLSGDKLTAATLRQRAIRLAECLQAAGIVAGDVIGVCSENRCDFPVPVFASILLGATVAPLNTSYIAPEMKHALNLSKPKIVFASATALPRILECTRQSKFTQKLISFDAIKQFIKPNNVPTTTTLTNFMKNPFVRSSSDFKCQPVSMHSTNALILCSSGTTGIPKGVQLSQTNLHGAISHMYLSSVMAEQLGFQMNCLNVMPWFHAYGILTMMTVTLCGRRTVTLTRYEDRAFLQAIQDNQCDMVFAVPPIIVMLSKSALVDNYDLSCLHVIYSGAAPLSKDLSVAVSQRLPSLMAVLQGFGMSEMTLSVLQQNLEFNSAGSVGVLLPGTWGKIVDPDTGRTLGPLERGEMCFKGSAVMRGYIGDDSATKNTIDAEGWLHTGDIGYYSKEGEWFIVDRLKELIKYKGFQVPPAELEAILLTHPDIADAGVIGIPDEVAGEVAKGFVVKRTSSKLTPQEVQDFVAAKVSYAKRLHGGVQLVAAIPKNVTGKILRRELRALHKSYQTKSKL